MYGAGRILKEAQASYTSESGYMLRYPDKSRKNPSRIRAGLAGARDQPQEAMDTLVARPLPVSFLKGHGTDLHYENGFLEFNITLFYTGWRIYLKKFNICDIIKYIKNYLQKL